jgi:hypothetical protein
LRSAVNWQVALKQKGVKQGLSVHHCKAVHLFKKYSQHPIPLIELKQDCKDSGGVHIFSKSIFCYFATVTSFLLPS